MSLLLQGHLVTNASLPCCSCLTRRLREQPDPEEKLIGHFARKGASASTREREEPEETEAVQDLRLQEDIIHVWTDRGIGSQHNAHNHSTAEGECSLQENIGRLHAWDNVSLLANASFAK